MQKNCCFFRSALWLYDAHIKAGQILVDLSIFVLGVVSCKVTLNSGVESESKMSVNVLPKPTITIDQHTITSPYNQPISIQCESHVADSSQPENDMLPEITWYKNGEVLDTSGKYLQQFLTKIKNIKKYLVL